LPDKSPCSSGYAQKLAVAGANWQLALCSKGFLIPDNLNESNRITKCFAKGLTISKASLYRLIETIKGMGAPIEYSITSQSFVYVDRVDFLCGFYFKELSNSEAKQINGGFNNLTCLVNF